MTKPKKSKINADSLVVQQVAVDALKPYKNNARIHDEKQVGQIAASIQEFGFNVPVLIDGNNSIIAGHGRALAAKQIGMTQVPTIRIDHLTDAQRRAFIIADNKLTENGGWNEEMLAAELAELQALDFDIGLTGFEAEEIERLMHESTAAGTGGGGSLSDKFLVPPFSVLNAREGWWQERKREWLALGIKSELGRGGGG